MPGKVVGVLVAEGDAVEKGAPLVILEAMKMEQTLTAPAAAEVIAVRCALGDIVDAGAVLVVLGEPTAGT
ncbi:MAG: acetyl-CoA carboxylase biotin carboxyl carrier protein subunit [Myxococcales bacterium]|nr:acetyl-CoA carboxylase biotin carboxyl carrier protein subunit [Myxococcales bacterium]